MNIVVWILFIYFDFNRLLGEGIVISLVDFMRIFLIVIVGNFIFVVQFVESFFKGFFDRSIVVVVNVVIVQCDMSVYCLVLNVVEF